MVLVHFKSRRHLFKKKNAKYIIFAEKEYKTDIYIYNSYIYFCCVQCTKAFEL